MPNNVVLNATIEVIVTDDLHCSETCEHFSKYKYDHGYHYCWFANSRGRNMLRSAKCLCTFGKVSRPDEVKQPRKRRTKAEMIQARQEADNE